MTSSTSYDPLHSPDRKLQSTNYRQRVTSFFRTIFWFSRESILIQSLRYQLPQRNVSNPETVGSDKEKFMLFVISFIKIMWLLPCRIIALLIATATSSHYWLLSTKIQMLLKSDKRVTHFMPRSNEGLLLPATLKALSSSEIVSGR